MEETKTPILKFKHLIILLLLGYSGTTIGALLKLLSHPLADLSLTISMCMISLSFLLGIIKLVLYKDKNSFLNK